MTAASHRSDHALRRMLLAAVLLFAQLVSPAMALGMLQAPGPMTVCRADGTVETLPVQHEDCAVCPACQVPSPVLAGSPPLPLPLVYAGQAASPAMVPARPYPLWINAWPRGPPHSAV